MRTSALSFSAIALWFASSHPLRPSPLSDVGSSSEGAFFNRAKVLSVHQVGYNEGGGEEGQCNPK